MHELPIIQQVLRTVLLYADSQHASRIQKVFLEIGEMHDLVPELVVRYFAFASRGTLAEGAQLLIARPPVVARCTACGRQLPVELHQDVSPYCPDCGGGRFQMVSGDQFHIRGVEFSQETPQSNPAPIPTEA